MSGHSEDNYVQCTQCGYIYQIKFKLNSEDIYTDSKCPVCCNKRALSIGKDLLLDKYELYDPYLDDRYYI